MEILEDFKCSQCTTRCKSFIFICDVIQLALYERKKKSDYALYMESLTLYTLCAEIAKLRNCPNQGVWSQYTRFYFQIVYSVVLRT